MRGLRGGQVLVRYCRRGKINKEVEMCAIKCIEKSIRVLVL